MNIQIDYTGDFKTLCDFYNALEALDMHLSCSVTVGDQEYEISDFISCVEHGSVDCPECDGQGHGVGFKCGFCNGKGKRKFTFEEGVV